MGVGGVGWCVSKSIHNGQNSEGGELCGIDKAVLCRPVVWTAQE